MVETTPREFYLRAVVTFGKLEVIMGLEFDPEGDEAIAQQVAAWAAEHGDDPSLRIVLCGAVGDYTMPAGWRIVMGKSRGANSGKERLWLSPHCLDESRPPASLAGPTYRRRGRRPTR